MPWTGIEWFNVWLIDWYKPFFVCEYVLARSALNISVVFAISHFIIWSFQNCLCVFLLLSLECVTTVPPTHAAESLLCRWNFAQKSAVEIKQDAMAGVRVWTRSRWTHTSGLIHPGDRVGRAGNPRKRHGSYSPGRSPEWRVIRASPD